MSRCPISSSGWYQQMRVPGCSSAVALQERGVELCSAAYFAPLKLFPNFGAKLDRAPLGSASDVLFL